MVLKRHGLSRVEKTDEGRGLQPLRCFCLVQNLPQDLKVKVFRPQTGGTDQQLAAKQSLPVEF